LTHLFDELSAESAEYMLTIWRTNTRRHSVHAAVYWNDRSTSKLTLSTNNLSPTQVGQGTPEVRSSSQRPRHFGPSPLEAACQRLGPP
jgi:hypothetical protein